MRLFSLAAVVFGLSACASPPSLSKDNFVGEMRGGQAGGLPRITHRSYFPQGMEGESNSRNMELGPVPGG